MSSQRATTPDSAIPDGANPDVVLVGAAWRPALREAAPSFGRRLAEDPALLAEVRAATKQTLELTG